jgi:prepilin-type N-terminal cleavage/methylation domain-containing protein
MSGALRAIRDRLGGQRGFTLIEVLIAASLMVVVLTATLNALDRTTQIQRKTEKTNDQQERIRLTLDRVAAQLRNLASPTTSTVKTIDRATSYDLIFQTTDPNKQWVRYCLADGTNSPSSFTGFVDSTPGNERLWYQTPNDAFLALSPQQSPTQVSGMTGTCPAPPAPSGTAGWKSATIVASRLTNKNNGVDRPVFSFNGNGTDTSTITYARTDLYGSFATTTNNPAESRLSTGEYLRNQNQSPTAVIQYQQGSGAASRTYQLNGTASSDPEGRTMSSFLWYKGTPAGTATATTAKLPSCATTAAADQTKTTSGETWTCIESGALVNHTFPAGDGGTCSPLISGIATCVAVALKVTDPGGLTGVATVNNLPLP